MFAVNTGVQVVSKSSVVSPVSIVAVPFEAINARNAVAFRSMIENEYVEGAQVVLDLSQCEFVNSAGLGAIVAAARRLAELRGDLRICSVRKPVQALFELVRMNKLVPVFEERQEAIESFSP